MRGKQSVEISVGSSSTMLAKFSARHVYGSCHPETLAEISWSRFSCPRLSRKYCSNSGLSCRRNRPLKIEAVDAAQFFDFEAKKLKELQMQRSLKIGLVGFGNFGQFLAEKMVKLGHTVLAHSRSDYEDIGRKMKVEFYRDADDFCEEHPEVIVMCTSILSTESALRSLPLQRLRRNTLFVDVLSVKEFPKNLFLQVLPQEFDVLCTHPMFGPQSGKARWDHLPFVYEKVRVGRGSRDHRCDKFLNIFQSEGCRMVEMSCEEHDRYAASSQFITHTVGRILGKLRLESSPINTKGYETLLDLVENTGGDSFDLYYGLFMYNVNATEELDRLEMAFDDVKKELFSKLHNILRSQLFEHADRAKVMPPPIPTDSNTQIVSIQLSDGQQTFGNLESTPVLNSAANEASSM